MRRHHISPRRTSVAATLTIALLMSLLAAVPASAAAPTISLEPSSGTAGATVTVQGHNFDRGRDATLMFGSALVDCCFRPDRHGRFTTTFVVPSGYDGDVTVTAELRTTAASATFTVPGTAPAPVPPPPGPHPGDARVTDGLQALYLFNEGQGTTVRDTSGVAPALDLSISDPASVRWLADGGIDLTSPTLVASVGPADKINAAVRASGELTVEAWMAPAHLQQSGPARAITLSSTHVQRNVTLGQVGGSVEARMRTTATDNNGLPALATSVGTLPADMTHVTYTRAANGDARLYLNGQRRGAATVSGDPTNWDPSYRLGLGDELNRGRPWLGTLRLVAVYDRALTEAEVVRNHSAGPDGSRPEPTPDPDPEPTPDPDPAPGPAPDPGPPPQPDDADRVLVDGEHFEQGFVVPQGQVWSFPADASTTVTTSGNVVVRGTLRLRPSSADVTHTLRFTDVDESAFVGGGTTVIDSDVGLWVMDAGVLDAVGTERQGWARQWHPTWRDDDEVVRAPTGHRDYFAFASHAKHDPVPRAFPDVPPAELINLTRNVVIEGTPEGRTHVMIHNHHSPQTIKNVAIRHAGPYGVLGRYALHFHHGFDATRGSLVENVVVRDGARGFVPHLSHGITFKHTVAYDMDIVGYWWDEPVDHRSDEAVLRSESDDIVYDHALAARIGVDSDGRSGINGFRLMAGTGNVVKNSVAVGVGGQTNSSGFHWPSRVNHSANVWLFENNVSHNNAVNGIYVWQNDSNDHIVDRFLGYRNGKAGIEHGAYGNPYVYRDSRLIANGGGHWTGSAFGAQLVQHLGQGRTNDATGTIGGYHGLTFDARGATDDGVHITDANLGSNVLWLDCTINGHLKNAVRLHQRTGPSASYDFVGCRVDGREMRPSDVSVTRNDPGSTIRIQQSDGTAWEISRLGTLKSIPRFR